MQERLNEKHITFFEILTNANKAADPVSYLKLIIKKDSRLQPILGYALNPKFRMPLPAGNPPYIPSQYPNGIAPLEILNLSNKLYVMYNKESKQYKKEEILVRWLEDMTPEEAELMVRIKDQTLDKAFPNLPTKVFLDALGWSEDVYTKLKSSQHTPANQS